MVAGGMVNDVTQEAVQGSFGFWWDFEQEVSLLIKGKKQSSTFEFNGFAG